MTTKLFLTDKTLETEVSVLECIPSEDGTFSVTLDRTPFYPQGGGQPCDTGFIGKSELIKVFENENGKICHIAKQEVPLGKAIAKVNVERRKLNTCLHSASHVISALIEGMGDWDVTKGSSFPGQARLEFKRKREEVEIPSIDQITEMLKDVVAQNLSFKENIDPETGFRIVTWGDLKAYPCGGTHVSSTAELADIVITKAHLKKGQPHVNFAKVLPKLRTFTTLPKPSK